MSFDISHMHKNSINVHRRIFGMCPQLPLTKAFRSKVAYEYSMYALKRKHNLDLTTIIS